MNGKTVFLGAKMKNWVLVKWGCLSDWSPKSEITEVQISTSLTEL